MFAQVEPWAVLAPGSATAAVLFAIWLLNRERREDRREITAAIRELRESCDRMTEMFRELVTELRVNKAREGER